MGALRMGLFKRLFGEQPAAPPGGGPGRAANVGLVRDTSDSLVDEQGLAAGPFPRTMRLRPVLLDYGLRGRWKVVSLEDERSWAAAREELIREYYDRFGLITFRNGQKTIRWNEFTWRGIREALEFEHDPAYAGDRPAGP